MGEVSEAEDILLVSVGHGAESVTGGEQDVSVVVGRVSISVKRAAPMPLRRYFGRTWREVMRPTASSGSTSEQIRPTGLPKMAAPKAIKPWAGLAARSLAAFDAWVRQAKSPALADVTSVRSNMLLGS